VSVLDLQGMKPPAPTSGSGPNNNLSDAVRATAPQSQLSLLRCYTVPR
jgi:hypothetical protein